MFFLGVSAFIMKFLLHFKILLSLSLMCVTLQGLSAGTGWITPLFIEGLHLHVEERDPGRKGTSTDMIKKHLSLWEKMDKQTIIHSSKSYFC